MPVNATASNDGAVLDNGLVRLVLERSTPGMRERVESWDGQWRTVVSALPSEGDAELDLVPRLDTVAVLRASGTEATLRMTGGTPSLRFAVDATLADGERFIRYRVTETRSNAGRARSLQSRYGFAEDAVDFCWAPHLRPRENDVIGQFAFKSPAIIVQRAQKLAALVADVDVIDAKPAQPVCLEPDMSARNGARPLLAYGFKDHEPNGLIYFRHRPDMVATIPPGARSYGYLLYVSAEAEPHYGYREIVRLLWQQFGERNFDRVIPQVLPLDRYADYALGYAISALWRDLPENGLERGGMVMGIKFPNDIWFHFFFNHLHTAFGLHRMGKRRGRADLIDKANKILELCLSAPLRDGAFPAIHSHQIINGIRHDRWISHAHWVGGSINYQTQIPPPPDQPAFSTMDLAWTAYWMLRWHQEIAADARLLERATACGALLLRSQLPSGSVPIWLHNETLEPLELLRESPGCAASGLLFAKLYEVTGERRFLDGAQRVARYVESTFMPQGWTDYESFFDSAGKPMDLDDPYSRQRPQNTFPIFWTAELAKLLHRLTKEDHYREQALRAVDYLLLFQAVWSPPYLTVKGFGSIAIGNGHTGWNDARAGIFAPGIADFHELAGNDEYLKRGVAAMRAPLALMYIPENEPVSSVFDKGPLGYADECYAHRGRDARLGPSTFDFSVGYALMAREELYACYGDAWIDVAHRRGVGIDGCTVREIRTNGRTIDVLLEDSVARSAAVVVALATSTSTPVRVCIDGKGETIVPPGDVRARVPVAGSN
ncbi:MAG TPA: hypothetical protein VGA51_11590 [Casimicrobiaceae bacterium]